MVIGNIKNIIDIITYTAHATHHPSIIISIQPTTSKLDWRVVTIAMVTDINVLGNFETDWNRQYWSFHLEMGIPTILGWNDVSILCYASRDSSSPPWSVLLFVVRKLILFVLRVVASFFFFLRHEQYFKLCLLLIFFLFLLLRNNFIRSFWRKE